MPTALPDGQINFAQNLAASGPAPSPQPAVAGLIRADQTITSAQILALNSTPVTLVAAPPAGSFIKPYSAIIRYNYGGVAYAGTTGALQLLVGTTVLRQVLLTLSTANIAAAASTIEDVPLSDLVTGATAATATTALDGGALTVKLQSANATTGTGTLHVTVFYTIESST